MQSLQPRSGLLEALENATTTLSRVAHHNIVSLNSTHQGVASRYRVKGHHSHQHFQSPSFSSRKMPISAQEWRVRTGLINASRIRTVSVFRSSKPTVSVSTSCDDSATLYPACPGSVPGAVGVIEAAQPVHARRESDSSCPALAELPSSSWKGRWALLLCLIVPLVPKMIALLITICDILGRRHSLIGGKCR